MPHLLVEYAAELEAILDVRELLDAVHAAARETRLFPESHIKARARPVTEYLVGGTRRPFLHAQVRIQSGRSPEQRRTLSACVLEVLRVRAERAVVTVEVVEMEAASYTRHYPWR
ncbi:MAG: 5-carboxymethyl-2-hydroxymuconate Delta-isomerase [Thioalkalivibrio sp.]|nr:5-carboxymethyl-2-hydroxymuconate Delta-isomerase [Thioalkalivibrio sp.]